MAKSVNGSGELKILLKDASDLQTVFYQSPLISITSVSDTYDLTYTHTQPTALDVQFEFDVGLKTQILILDKVSLKQEATLSSSDEQLSTNFEMYPNPVSKLLHINSTIGVEHIDIVNMNGKRVLTYRGSGHINVDDLQSGLYLLRVQLKNGAMGYRKLIIK